MRFTKPFRKEGVFAIVLSSDLNVLDGTALDTIVGVMGLERFRS